jgi:hypothetical protein
VTCCIEVPFKTGLTVYVLVRELVIVIYRNVRNFCSYIIVKASHILIR